jgi:hypothetical protein
VNYTIPADLSGHKCLFARTFSFSPVDLPIDDYQLSPPLDRHVAQLNLNIVAQSSSFMFNLVHLPNAMDRIELIPMNAEEVFSLRHPFLADLKPRRSGTARFMERMKVIMKDQGESGSRVRLIKRGRSVYFHSYNDRAISLQQQKVIVNNLHRVLRIKSDNAVHHREFREVFQAFRKMNRRVEQMEFELQIPDMKLAPGEASALKIVATNRVTGEMKGGITLIITG